MHLLIAATALVFACEPPEILSGDTLRCEGRTVRIVGIRAEGPDAASTLQRIVDKRATICQSEDGSAGSQMVARCWTLGTDLGCAMLQAGQAVRRPSPQPACL
jgi:endonuclease YncB( thermonuclease family)